MKLGEVRVVLTVFDGFEAFAVGPLCWDVFEWTFLADVFFSDVLSGRFCWSIFGQTFLSDVFLRRFFGGGFFHGRLWCIHPERVIFNFPQFPTSLF